MKNPFFKSVKEVSGISTDVKPSVYANMDVVAKLKEQFKGEVEQKKVTFPADLGEEHPFDFKYMEELCKSFGFYNAILDKYVDYIWGPGFYIKCKNARAKTILEDFMKDVDLTTLGRAWTKEGLNKGSGFMEIGGDKKKGVKGMKVLNANYMYVERDNKGIVKSYNQYKGAFDKFAKEKIVSIDKENIAHFNFNVIGDCAYGLGLGYPALKLIDDWLSQQKSEHLLMDRKANSPIHAKVGYISDNKQIVPKQDVLDTLGKDIETMSNKTNWVTDPLVDFKVIDFGNIGDKFTEVLQNDLDMLFYSFQMPPAIMGKANIAEGIAEVNVDAFQRRIQAIQAELEKVIEQKIFKRVLNANGLEVDVEFEWGTPSIMETEGRLALVTDMLKSATTGEAMRIVLEDEFINLLKLDKDEWEKLKLEQNKDEEEERKRLEAQPQPVVPGQNKGFPQPVQPKAQQPKQPKPEEVFKDIMKILAEQETKRNDLFIKQQTSLTEEQKKKDEQNIEFIKQVITQLQSGQKEVTINSQLESDISDIKTKLESKPKVRTIKQRLKKTSLLPAFRITRKTESYDVEEYIKKVGDEYCVFSHQTGHKFGCYPTKIEAEKRLEQIKGFREKTDIEVYNKRDDKLKNYEYEKDYKQLEEGLENYNTIEEWLGFSYKAYLKQILGVLAVHEFAQLKAINEIELGAGYLTETQIGELKSIMEKGFKNGTGLKAMARQVDKQVGLKDLYIMGENGKLKIGASGLPRLARSADKRAIGIVRTETTRLANQGAVKYYKENNVKSIKHIASYGKRTCEVCASLDGTIYKIGEEPGLPVHPLCRCSYSPVVELI